ncbi:MAG: rhodanese-like domain-containing protein [Betaproteobacteria bacterium]|nr:rhodanese-like domain-containing protein [Betaproteobacteria bacterium]
MKRGFKVLVAEAEALVPTYTVQELLERQHDPVLQLVDVRDVRELEREGTVPGAFHAPRGLLEFWVDPESPYFKPLFGEPREFVLFCAAGWRSVLAARTLMEMGLPRVAHLAGGFGAWKTAGAPVLEKPRKPAP